MERIKRLWARSDDELRDALRSVDVDIRVLQSAKLALIRELDRRPAPAGSRTGTTAKTFLTNGLRQTLGEANRDIAAAYALDPDDGELPEHGTALAAGEISRAHVDIAVRTIKRLPTPWKTLVAEDGEPYSVKVDRLLTEQAKVLPPQDVDRLAKELLAAADPDGVDRFDPDAHERRAVVMKNLPAGMVSFQAILPEAEADAVRAAYIAWGKPDPVHPDEQGELIPDLRTPTQRRADAFVALFRRLPNAETPLAQAQIVVVATLEQFKAAAAGEHDRSVGLPDNVTTGRPVGTRTLARYLCEATVMAMRTDRNGKALWLGRSERLASSKQRAALAARDKGCVVPGCPLPPAACDAHHVTPWSRGGPTDIDQLALLCTRHHAEVHAGTWILEMRDGIPWAIPPRIYDPDQRPRRNHAHEHLAAARTLGDQLRLDLGDAS